ncbi:MAG: gliding motility-associated-like protein, partial [Crocinitomicaceae bacterium]
NGVIDGVPFFPSVGSLTYTVTGTDANGCVNTDQMVITVAPLPIVDAGVDQQVCDGASVTLNGAGAVSYVWDNGITNGVPFTPAVGTITYTVTGTDANGCVNTDQVDVTVFPLPAINAGVDQQVCDGSAVTLNGSGGVSYVWDNGITDGVPFTPAVGTITYTVTGTDANGCVNTDQVDVTVFPLPVVNAGVDQQVCDGSSVTLSGAGAISYVWDNGITDGVPFTPAVGTITYTVTGTDANGCVNTDQVDVTVFPLPVVNAGVDQQVCDGSLVTLSGAGAVSYVWNNGITDGVPFTPAVGTITYTVTGTDANGCVNTDQVDVTVFPLPVINAGVDQQVCDGSTVTLNGSGGVSYVWDNGITDGLPFTPAVGTITYTVTGTDANGCINTDQVDVTVFPLPVINAGVDQQVCEGTPVTLNGSGAVSYVWDNGITNGVPFTPAVGTITYTVTGTDANGCVNTDQVDVTVFGLPAVNAGLDQEECDGVSVTLNGSGAVSYVWDNGVTDGVPFFPAVGTITYTVIGTDANGCSNSDQVDIIINALPVIDAGNDETLCDEELVTLLATGAPSLLWDNGVINGVPFLAPLGTTIYTVTGTDIKGCVNTDQASVTSNSLPAVTAGVDQAICEGESVTLSGSGAVSYTWTGGVVDGVPFTPAVGSHQFIVTGLNGSFCASSDTVLVTVNPNPIVNAGADQQACEGDMITLSSTGSPNLYWDNGVVNGVPFQQGLGIVTYTVVDSLSTGCTASDIVQVEVHPRPVVSAEDKEICEGEGVTLSGSGALSYTWTGGVLDGIEFFPTVTGEYTVTGANAFGCTADATVTVTVSAAPIVNFKILDFSLSTSSPGTGFENLTTGAVSYEWDFGDGSNINTEFEPYHEFPTQESGSYEIILTAYSAAGCPGQKIKYVYVTQDYTIYVPNAFTPDGNGANEIFKPVMEGFNENDYTLYIFNRWGELIFESHNMEVGWDGQYSQHDERVQDGVFTWKIVAGLKDSADSKIFVGHVSLLK